MNAAELKSEQTLIDNDVRKIAEQLEVTAITDGVISPDHYVESLIKTAWVYKEPNAPGDAYDYKEAIVDRINNGDNRRDIYFDPMRYLEYSLRNNLVLYDDIPDADNCPAVSRLLLNTAFINRKKMPGGARVGPDYQFYADKFNDVVKRQLTVAKPKIIIAAGTKDFFDQNGYFTDCSSHVKSYGKYYANENHIILVCRHPLFANQKNYCNDMIEALRDAKSKGFLK